jgi:inner membrane protein
MEHQQQQNTLTSIWDRNKMLIKGFMIGFLILIMLIPVAFISELITEREQRQNEVTNEISSKWASAQTIVGPVVAIPYLSVTDTNKAVVKRYLYILPEKLNITGKLLPEVRHRSLYEVTLYRSRMTLAGTFDPAYIQKLGIAPEQILWNESTLMLGLNDARGLEEDVTIQWDTSNTVLEAGMPDNNVVGTGLSAKLAIDPQRKVSFNININLKGSTNLYFTPVGKTTEVTMSSPWKNPAFDGQYLPSQPATINESGFSAKWKILQVSRNYPQVWKDASHFEIEKSAFGVKLIQPTDGYSKTDRSIKYAILIIALTFTIFFFVEIFQKRQIHPLQYILIGIALCVFYTLLLSISEYIGFNGAYLIATIATVTLISLYILGIFKQIKIAGGFALALGGLYTYIFVLIQLQDYSLLFGSIGLFVILAIIMYFSRKIDWYGTGRVN